MVPDRTIYENTLTHHGTWVHRQAIGLEYIRAQRQAIGLGDIWAQRQAIGLRDIRAQIGTKQSAGSIIMHKYDNKLLKWSMSHTPMRKSLASLKKYRNMLLNEQSFGMG
jgi:hypothetical protein